MTPGALLAPPFSCGAGQRRRRWLGALLASLALLGGVPAAGEDGSPTDDLADVPAETVAIDEDRAQRYVRIGPVGEDDVPAKGHPLLVILPGGDGGEGFGPFCRRILKHACPGGWVGAQLIAPKWTADQTVVWPTEEVPVEGARFTTEDHIEAVIRDAKRWRKIDPARVFVLAWSSSGPAAWALSYRKQATPTGYLIAMSVFKPSQLPARPPTRRRAWYLLHSPDDRVCPYRMAEDAVARLRKARAKVKLSSYEGGHGWRGDVYGLLREGLDFLAP